MMTQERPPPGAETGVPFRALRRIGGIRTSEPTSRAVRAAMLRIALSRETGEPSRDAVILAALRVADPVALDAEVEKIEREFFPQS